MSNTGDMNTGYRNAGDRNTGAWNTGSWNTGACNAGDWNAGDWNTGLFNTNEPKLRMFNKKTDYYKQDINDKFTIPDYLYFNLTEWINKDNMTNEEKEVYSYYETTNGYLKKYEYKESCLKSFKENCDKKQAQQTIDLPNFDYSLFEKITGITKAMLEAKLDKKINSNPKEIIIKGAKYILKE